MSRSSRSTLSSGFDSALHPITPRSTGSHIQGHFGTPSITGDRFLTTSELFSEPPLIELDDRSIAPKSSEDFSEDLSKPHSYSGTSLLQPHSVYSSSLTWITDASLSENTIRQEPRSSFSSDHTEEGSTHLGQRENAAFDRMPKLKTTTTLSKGLNKRRFEILTSPMRTDDSVNPNWVGVSSMEGLRSITRRPGKLTQVSAVESLIKRETQFLSDSTDEYLAHRLRSNPAILGIGRLESFLNSVLEDSRTLRMVNQNFRNALQANSNVMSMGFSQFSLVCKEGTAE